VDAFDEWFHTLALSRRVFVPLRADALGCAAVHDRPGYFVCIDDIVESEFYPSGSNQDTVAKSSFDTLMQLMAGTHAHWLARVYVEGCEPQRAEEIGELAVDLAIVAFQLAAPNLDTRGACRLDSQRGSAEKRVISEANGSYDAGRTRRERGSAIGPGRSRTS
jgi:hypothetical protein